MFPISGHQAISVTLKDVTGRTFSLRISTAGSGLLTRLVCHQPTVLPFMTGLQLEGASQSLVAISKFTFHFILRFQPPQKQPDNREQIQQGGESESCMAVLNNFYGDGE